MAKSVDEGKVIVSVDLIDFDITDVICELVEHGAVSLPMIPEIRRGELLDEAQTYTYEDQPEIVGGGLVREELSSVTEFPDNSLFWRLKNDFTELFTRKISTLKVKDLFSTSLLFNDMSLQRYRVGSIGITPHKDGKSRINLICVFILTGQAEFAICDDRSGSNARFLDTMAGNLIILRGPGFLNSEVQPFHFVRNITHERIVFGLRQRPCAHAS